MPLLFLNGMLVVFSGIFTGMMLLKWGERQDAPSRDPDF